MMRRLVVRCPICEKVHLVKIPAELLEKRAKMELGIVPLYIRHNGCAHGLIAYIDHYFSIRHYIPIDSESDLPFTLKLIEEPIRFDQMSPSPHKKHILAFN